MKTNKRKSRKGTASQQGNASAAPSNAQAFTPESLFAAFSTFIAAQAQTPVTASPQQAGKHAKATKATKAGKPGRIAVFATHTSAPVEPKAGQKAYGTPALTGFLVNLIGRSRKERLLDGKAVTPDTLKHALVEGLKEIAALPAPKLGGPNGKERIEALANRAPAQKQAKALGLPVENWAKALA